MEGKIAMLKDLRIGLAVWKGITNFKYASVQFSLIVAAGFMAVMLVAPRLYERVNEFSLSVNIDGNKVIQALALLHIVTFGIAMKQIVYRAYGRNKDLFYQLAVSKKAGYICTMFQQINWYGYAVAMLLAICGHNVVPWWFLIPAYTLLFFMGFYIYYNIAASGIYKRKRLLFCYRSGRSESRGKDFFNNHPVLEVLKISIQGLYRCKSLTAAKIILIFLIVCCGKAGMLSGGVFLLGNAFLIILNDGYWRNESCNFRYFSEIGIPVSRYLRVHFLTGICFNIVIPLLLFYGITGELLAAAASFFLLSYLLIFWYMAQVYLYFIMGRDREGGIMLGSLFFLVMALLPPAGLVGMIWLYKRIIHKWRENECSR